MQAAVLHEFGKPLTIEEVETPTAGPNEVVVKVMACGIDGTDLKMLEGFGYRPDLPFIIGHEPSGRVESVGPGVENVQPGDHVVTHNFSTCGKCRNCRSNREQICPNMTGVLGAGGLQGAYAEYLKMPVRQLVQVSESLSWEDAAVLSDAGITAFHAVDRSRLKLGETALVLGVGGVGSFAVQFAKLAGATVIAVDQSEAKCARATELGADHVINSSSADVAEEARRLTDGWGVDCAIDIVGLQATISAGIDALANGGRLVIIGYTPEEYSLNGKRMAQNELEIIGTRCGRKQDLVGAAAMVASGKTKSIVTDSYPFEKINEALDLLRAGKVLGRCVCKW